MAFDMSWSVFTVAATLKACLVMLDFQAILLCLLTNIVNSCIMQRAAVQHSILTRIRCSKLCLNYNLLVTFMHSHVWPAGAKGRGGKQVNLFDEYSRNGTSVDGNPVVPGRKRPCVVALGSVIKFGRAATAVTILRQELYVLIFDA